MEQQLLNKKEIKIMANFDGVYVKTAELGTFSDGRKIELGHYSQGETEYSDKIYITGTYTTKKGEEKSFVNATKLTLKDLAELQQIDLSGYDTEAEVSFD